MAHRPSSGPPGQSDSLLTQRKHSGLLTAGLACLSTASCLNASPSHPPVTMPARSHTPAAVASASADPTYQPSPTARPNPAGLSDAQMVGQLFIGYVHGSSASAATPAQRAANIALYGEPLGAQIVGRWHLGGIILLDHNSLDPARPLLSTGNVDSSRQIRNLTTGLQAAAEADSHLLLLIGTDQEGGRVQRLTHEVTNRPTQRTLAALTPTALRCSYFTLGRQLRALGINQDYAPVADVLTTSGGVIGDRSFGPDPSRDATDVTAASRGLREAGVLATLKHWPGHGSTSTDSHAALAVIHESAQLWRASDRVPFAAAATQAGAVMVGHLALPALDPSGLPATLSPTLVNGALRQELGFTGLALTDSLYMEPMQVAGSPSQIGLRVLAAGEDMLLESPNLPEVYATLLQAVHTSRTIRAQVVAAVGRILRTKALLEQTPRSTC